jgi:hypothetical protein
MKIEIINNLAYTDFPGIKWQLEQVATGQSDELWLATPHEDAVRLLHNFGIAPEKVYDMYTQRYLKLLDETKGIWWADVTVPNEAQVIVNNDLTKSVMSQGQQLASQRWYANSERIVQAMTWYDGDGVVDYKTIYYRDGQVFAKQYFSEGNLLQSDFYGDHQQIAVSDFYFENNRNFVVSGDKTFANSDEYIASVGNAHDGNYYRITQLGRELDFAPKGTTLTMIGGILNEAGEVYPNLLAILQQPEHAVAQIEVTAIDRQKLADMGVPLEKMRVLAEEVMNG